MQNRATLRNALRKHYELPSVSNDMQSSETLRNSLGLNYKSTALPAGSIARLIMALGNFQPMAVGNERASSKMRACQLAVFSDKLPLLEGEIDCKLQSNPR